MKNWHWRRPSYWERLKTGEELDDRGWDGWMASPNQWTWVWASSSGWWWTGKPGMLQSRGSKQSDMTEQLNWTEWNSPLSGASWVVLVVNNPPVNAGHIRDAGSIPWLGRSPTEQLTPVFLPGGSGGERSLATSVHEVAKSGTALSDLIHKHTHPLKHLLWSQFSPIFFKPIWLWIFYRNFICCMWSEPQCAFRQKLLKTR